MGINELDSPEQNIISFPFQEIQSYVAGVWHLLQIMGC